MMFYMFLLSRKNLQLINHLTKNDYKVVFYKNKENNINSATIYNNKRKRIYTSYTNNLNAYKIITNINSNHINTNFDNTVCYSLEKALEDSNMNSWHKRLGHSNIDLIIEEFLKKKKINIDHKCKV